MVEGQLTPQAELAIEKQIRRRMRELLAVVAGLVSILAGLVSWGVTSKSDSLARAAVISTLADHKAEIQSTRILLVELLQDIGGTEARTEQAAIQITALERETAAASTRLQTAIEVLEGQLGQAEALETALETTGSIAEALASHPGFQAAVRERVLDDFSERDVICRSLTVQNEGGAAVRIETDAPTGGVLRLFDENHKERTLSLSPAGTPTFSAPLVCQRLTVEHEGKPMVDLTTRADSGEGFQGNILVHGDWGESPAAVNIETVNDGGYIQLLDKNSKLLAKLP